VNVYVEVEIKNEPEIKAEVKLKAVEGGDSFPRI
jgi:hypothetical protein